MVPVVLLLTALAAQAPEPARPELGAPLPGALVLAGDGGLDARAVQRFLDLAGDAAGEHGGRPLLVVSGAPRPDELRLLAPRADLLPAGALDRPELCEAVRAAHAVWLGGGDAARYAEALEAGAPLALALRAVAARGGAIGAAGEAARLLDAEDADLLPGFALAADAADLERRLAETPGRPVIALADGAAAELAGRELTPLSGEVRVRVAGDPYLPPAGTVEYRGGRPIHDLVALSRAALERARPEALGRPRVPSGALVLSGGGAVGDEAIQRFVALAGGPDAPLCVVPAPREVGGEPRMVARLRAAGARDVTWAEARGRAAADRDPVMLAALARARGVWIGGGRAFELIDLYEDTEVQRLLADVLARGGVVGGVSAGAAVQAQVLLRGGPLRSPELLSAGYERGFGLLPGCAIDAHFSERARFQDLLAAKRARPDALVIGIDEGTALIVQGSTAEVVGRGSVFLFDGAGAPRRPDGAATRVRAGGRYDLLRRAALGSGDGPAQPAPALFRSAER